MSLQSLSAAQVRLRCSQLFSPFTLCKNYLLLMYHVRTAHIVGQKCSGLVLERDMAAYTTEHPQATTQQVLTCINVDACPETLRAC